MTVSTARNLNEQPWCGDPAVAHPVEVADVLLPAEVGHPWGDIRGTNHKNPVRWQPPELLKDVQRRYWRKLLACLDEEINTAFVGLGRDGDDVIPLGFLAVATMRLFFDYFGDLERRSFLGESPNPFGR